MTPGKVLAGGRLGLWNSIYKFPCPKEKQGWYTGMPYGPVDLLPIEAPQDVLNSYKAVVFLGWNNYLEEDFAKLHSFVENGGTVLLAKPHMNTELRHEAPAQLPQSKILDTLLGKGYGSATGIVRRNIGKGKVVWFASDVYPADSSIRNEYKNELVAIGETMIATERKRGWIKGTDVVGFTAYDWEDDQHRTIYLLNTDWWSNDTVHTAKLLLKEKEFEIKARRGYLETITINDSIAVMPASMQTDIMEVRSTGNVLFLKVQTTGPDTLTLYDSKGNRKEYFVKEAGLHKVIINMNK
jgi:hypothetical protein